MIIRGGKPIFFKNAKAAEYQRTIKVLAKAHRPENPFDGPLVVDFVFIIPRPARLNRKSDPDGLIPCPARPDRDNLQKGTQDALSDFWIDDGQIFDGRTAKFYAEKNGDARIIVTIRNAEVSDGGPLATALDLSEIDDTKSDDHIALQLANLVLRKDVVRLAKENAELKRLAGLSVKHRWHAAGEVALDKLADYLPNDQMRDG